MADQWYMSPVIRITVGVVRDQKAFNVHQDLLALESEYFKVGLNSDFAEGRSKTFKLEKDDPEAFELFVQYLYNGTYALKPSDAPNRLELLYDLQARAYILGDKLIANGFKAAITSTFKHQFTHDGISMMDLINVAKMVYEGTLATKSQDFRDALVDQCAERFGRFHDHWEPPAIRNQWTRDEMTALVESGLDEFVIDVLQEVSHSLTA